MSEVLELTCDLIRRPSVTPDDAGCQSLLAQRLAAAGCRIEHLRFGNVDNLWATHGSGSPVLVLLGHTDVVPCGPVGDWTTPPFEPVQRDGCLYGRGAADMKGSVAAMCLALESFVVAHPDHPGTLAMLLTSDEEGDAKDGVRRVAATFQERGQSIDWCVVGEPSSTTTLGDVVRVGRRGSLTGYLQVYGVQGHVAYPDLACNPIHAVAPALAELAATHWDDGNADFPPTSFQISNIHAGTGATNVIPGVLEIVFNFRFCTASTAVSLQQRCSGILDKYHVEHSVRWDLSGEPFLTADGPLRTAVLAAVQDVCGIAAHPSTGGGTSDGRFIAPLGASVVELGPVNASIHKIDEHIAIEALERMPRLYERVLERLLLESVT